MIEHVVDIDIDCHSGTVVILIPSIAAVPAVAAAKPKPIVTPLIVVAEAAVAAKVATAAIAAVITALGLGEGVPKIVRGIVTALLLLRVEQECLTDAQIRVVVHRTISGIAQNACQTIIDTGVPIIVLAGSDVIGPAGIPVDLLQRDLHRTVEERRDADLHCTLDAVTLIVVRTSPIGGQIVVVGWQTAATAALKVAAVVIIAAAVAAALKIATVVIIAATVAAVAAAIEVLSKTASAAGDGAVIFAPAERVAGLELDVHAVSAKVLPELDAYVVG